MRVGDKIKFAEEKQRYTVQACDARFLVCTKPFNPQHTVLYTIVDLQQQIRGTENLIFGAGAETREQCEQMLDRLNGRYPDRKADPFSWEATEVSYRNRIPLIIESVNVEPHVLVMYKDEAPTTHTPAHLQVRFRPGLQKICKESTC